MEPQFYGVIKSGKGPYLSFWYIGSNRNKIANRFHTVNEPTCLEHSQENPDKIQKKTAQGSVMLKPYLQANRLESLVLEFQ